MKSLSLKSIFFIAVFWLYTILNLGNYKHQNVIVADVISYYSYLPATFIEHDLKLNFLNDSSHQFIPNAYWNFTLPNGNHVFKMSMGLSFMYAPFFIVAHALAAATGFEANGFSSPYQLALLIAGWFYACCGLLLLRKLLLKYFNEHTTMLTILIISIGTNLTYYVSNEGALTHAFSFLLFAAVLLLNEKWNSNPTIKNSVLLGFTIGLISLIRPSNSIVILIPLLYQVYDKASLIIKIQFLKLHFPKIVLAAAIAFCVWIPQLIYWKLVTNQWLFYSYLDEHFYFSNPHILEVLFSFRKGWFIYTPLMFLAVAGMFLLRKMKSYLLPITVFMLMNVYIISSWWCWWYGGSFGMRTLVESYAILSIPLALMVSKLLESKQTVRTLVVSVIVIFISWNLYITYQYKRGVIHYDSMTAKAYVKLFSNFHAPDGYEKLLSAPDYEQAKLGNEKYKWE